MGNKRSISARQKAGKNNKFNSDTLPETVEELIATLPSTSEVNVPKMGCGQRQRKSRTDVFIPELEDAEEEEQEDQAANVGTKTRP